MLKGLSEKILVLKIRKYSSPHCMNFKEHLKVVFRILVLGLGWVLFGFFCYFWGGSGGVLFFFFRRMLEQE